MVDTLFDNVMTTTAGNIANNSATYMLWKSLGLSVKGVHTAQKDIQQSFKADHIRVKINADGLPVTGALVFYVLIGGIGFIAAGVAADHVGNAGHLPERGGDAPEAASGKISGLGRVHSDSILSEQIVIRKASG